MQKITRRAAVLGTAGVAASAAVAVVHRDDLAAAGGWRSSSARPTRADWTAFAKTVTGPVDLPGTSQYSSSKLLFDTRCDGSAPVAVFGVQSAHDIAQAMAFANRFNLQVTARSGGHSYVGASAQNGTMVLDIRALQSVDYNSANGLATIGAGVGLYQAHNALLPHGRTFPTGTCPTVGAAGLTFGGGLGVASRAHGLTCDQLQSATLVLPNGQTVTADSSHNSDIFWALRGGGGGNIGIATSLTYRTHQATSKGIFSLYFPSADATRMVTGWAAWSAGAPRSQWAGVHIDADGNGAITPSILGVTEAGYERTAAAALISAIGADPVSSQYQEMSYANSILYLGGGSTSKRQGFAGGSDVLAAISTDAANAIIGAVAARSKAGSTASALLDPLTGAVGDVASTGTAFPWRRHNASIQWYCNVPASSGYASAYSWINSAHRDVAKFSSGGYVNYLETGMPASRYYAGNRARLAQVRQSHDPARRIYSGLTV